MKTKARLIILYVALAIGWALSSYAEVAPAPRLWLAFEGNYADSGTSTNTHIATPIGSPVFTNDVANATCGMNSIYLAGDGSSVSVANSPDLNFNHGYPFSVSAWIRTTNYGTVWSYASSVGNSSATHTLCCWVDNGSIHTKGTVGINVYYGNSTTVFSTTPVNDGAWHNLILTYNPIVGWNLYLDGVSNAATTGIDACNEGANYDAGYWNLTVGSTLNVLYPNETGSGNPFTGEIDEVGYWDKVLTPNQVASIYSAGIPTQTINITTEPVWGPVYFGGVTNPPSWAPTYATFSVGGTPVGLVGSIGYQWQSNGVNIASATSTSYTTPNFGTNAAYNYQCILTVSNVTVGSSIVTVKPVVPIPPRTTPLLWLGFNNNLNDSGYSTSNHLASFVGSGATYTNDVANPSNGTASLFLPGDGSYVLDTNTEDVSFDKAFAVSAWIKTTNPGVIWSKSSVSPSGSQAFACYVRTNGVIQVNRDSSVSVRITGTRVVTDGQWHHVVVTPPTWYLYVDGYLDVANGNTSVGSGSGAPNMCFTVGATLYANDPSETGVPGEPFKGQIDEVEFWPTNFTAAQVASVYLFNAPRASILITQQPTNVTVNAGQTATFQIAGTLLGASGTINYQWASNGVSIVGATSATYTTPPLTGSADGANYSCQLTAGSLIASSGSALLGVVSPPPRPLLWLPFNGNYADLGASNSFHVVTPVGDPVFTSDVQTNANSGTASLYLSGDGSFIDVTNCSDLNFSNPYTITAWIKTPTYGVITAKSTTNVISAFLNGTHTEAFFVQLNVFAYAGALSGALAENFFYGSWTYNPTFSTEVVDNGQWTFVAVTFDAITSSLGEGTSRLYINGLPDGVGTCEYKPNEGANEEGPWDFTVGATLNPIYPQESGVGDPFTGSIDQVAFWNRALGPGEINYVYQYGVEGPTLSISKSGGNVVLSWAVTGYKLQQNSSLTNPGGWTDVAGGGTSPVTVAIGASSQFFRLVTQ